MAIIAFVVLGFSATVIMMIQSNEKSKNYTIATAMAQDKVEELKAEAAAGLALTSGSDSTSKSGFKVTWTIPDPDVTGLPTGVTSILVKVDWTEDEPQSVALHTVVAEDTGGGSGSTVGSSSGDDDDD